MEIYSSRQTYYFIGNDEVKATLEGLDIALAHTKSVVGIVLLVYRSALKVVHGVWLSLHSEQEH